MDNRNRFRNNKPVKTRIKEENAIVLDVTSSNMSSYNSSNIIQAIGFNTYSLLELVPKQGIEIKSGQKVYIGDGKRDEIQYIKRVLFPDKLTGSAESELLFVIMDIVEEKEEFYVKFFNTAGPISLRRHAFEIIPGIGKKNLKHIVEIREDKPFESFKDIEQRCSFLGSPVKAISERIFKEINGETEHKFFARTD